MYMKIVLRPTLFIVAALFVSCFTNAALASTSPEELQAQIQEVRATVQKEQENLSKLKREEQHLASQLKAAEIELGKIRGKGAMLTGELASLEQDLQFLTANLDRLSLQEQDLSQRLSSRLRFLYVHRQLTLPDVFLRVGAVFHDPKKELYFSRLHAADLRLKQDLVEVRERVAKSFRQRSEMIAGQEDMLRALQSNEQTARSRVDSIRDLKLKLAKQREQREEKMLTLEAQALRLEAIVASLTGDEDALVHSSGNSARVQERARKSSPFKGPGLFRLKGSLLEPLDEFFVTGEFGRQNMEGFKELVVRKGLTLEATGDRTIRAIASGQVAFVGEIPGVSLVVIVDHGQRYYSLYGLLAKAEVRTGDRVDRGDTIGNVSDDDKSLHFEVRHLGTSLNPEQYYNRRFRRK